MKPQVTKGTGELLSWLIQLWYDDQQLEIIGSVEGEFNPVFHKTQCEQLVVFNLLNQCLIPEGSEGATLELLKLYARDAEEMIRIVGYGYCYRDGYKQEWAPHQNTEVVSETPVDPSAQD